MKLGFVCVNFPGHLNPISTLARELRARDHEVVFIHASVPGLPSIPAEDDPFREIRSEMATASAAAVIDLSYRAVIARTELILQALPAIVETHGLQALIIDHIQLYAELGAIRLGLPYIHVSAALHFDPTCCSPPCIYDWPHETTPEAFERNRDGMAVFMKILNCHNAGVKAYARSAGLDVDWDDLGSTASPWAWITQVPKAFEFESSHWPSHFYHTGPFHDPKYRAKVDFPWEEITGEPLIYASMGTIVNGRPEVFRAIVGGAEKLKGFQLVLAVGDQLDPDRIGRSRDSTIIVQHAPQLELLHQASACITHGGLNTVLESLSQGVPQVAIPVTYDQPGIGARIREKQTGVVTSLDKLSPDHLARLLVEVLANPVYRDNACQMQEAIAEANGLSTAADLVEQSLQVPVEA